jgi:hypothetical protein
LKNSNTVKGIIFCIPFLRNISELISNESNKKNKQYEILSNYLHYNVGFEELTFTEIEEIMKLYSVKYDKARINSKY